MEIDRNQFPHSWACGSPILLKRIRGFHQFQNHTQGQCKLQPIHIVLHNIKQRFWNSKRPNQNQVYKHQTCKIDNI
ncbi:hypothetical protein Ahy_A03g011765 isoform C [Arachis hypogaea]|uniref:Uncharacterized protein n=1 Tax=Arachis hypogaea TaxID=3818 RepID=A0A445DRN5_ARAHY|nr:hypothetical protein Ahy_A03g011765 isoform C [Arachis hypogaea]